MVKKAEGLEKVVRDDRVEKVEREEQEQAQQREVERRAEPARVPEVERRAQPTRAPAGDVSGIINTWWIQHIHNSVIARDTESYNYLQNAMKDLERKLKGE